MAQLIFKGPFHFSQFKSLQLKGKAGIYIWGFTYETDNGELTQALNLQNENYGDETSCILKDEWKFIPYYVGLKNGSLADRLKEHHAVRTNASATKYVRMYDKYYKEFFMDPDFPINTGSSSWICSSPVFNKKIRNCIEYFNNMDILRIHLYPNQQVVNTLTNPASNHNPITNITVKNVLLNDSLNKIVEFKNNFWFCFAGLPDSENSNENMESQTFYSLKGKTVGETKPYNPSGFGYAIDAEASCKDIFKLDLNGDIVANQNFPGYL